MAKYVTGLLDKVRITFDILKQNGGIRGKELECLKKDSYYLYFLIFISRIIVHVLSYRRIEERNGSWNRQEWQYVLRKQTLFYRTKQMGNLQWQGLHGLWWITSCPRVVWLAALQNRPATNYCKYCHCITSIIWKWITGFLLVITEAGNHLSMGGRKHTKSKWYFSSLYALQYNKK